MKKTILALAILALLASVSSCTKEKEGMYNPKQKIQTVYLDIKGYQEGELVFLNPKYKSEDWTWNDNRIDRIDYYELATYYGEDSDTTVSQLAFTQLFSYDKGDRLTKSEILGEMNMVATYTYDGNYLESITITEYNRPYLIYRFSRTDKKVTSIDITVNEDEFKKGTSADKAIKQLMRANPLRFVMSPEIAARTMTATQECTQRMAKKGCTKAEMTVTLNVEWDGENISKISGTAMDETMTMTFKYDNKNNPFYGLFGIDFLLNESIVPYQAMSCHNITHLTLTYVEDGEEESESADYSYTYNNKDFPTTKVLEEVMTMTDWVYDEETGEYELVELGDYRFVQTEYYEY